MHNLKLRAASHNLWQSSPPETDLHGFLLSAARTLFQQVVFFSKEGISLLVCITNNLIFLLCFFYFQIIFAHRKSFEANNYAAIKSILYSFQENMVKVFIYLCMCVCFVEW